MKIVLKIVGYLTLDANSMGDICFWVRHFEEAFMRVREDTALLSTHEDLFGGVIICWFLRWMECVVGNEKTITLIMTWFCTNQALLGCLVLHYMQKDCDIQCMQYSGCNWGCDYLHGSELLILLNLYKWVGWDVMAVGYHNNTNM